MSTNLNAEEIAEKRYPYPDGIGEWSRADRKHFIALCRPNRHGYAAAIREVAQPLADERDALKAEVERSLGTTGYETVPKQAFDELREALEQARAMMREAASLLLNVGGFDAGHAQGTLRQGAREIDATLAKYAKP